jgi:hypothetical protein
LGAGRQDAIDRGRRRRPRWRRVEHEWWLRRGSAKDSPDTTAGETAGAASTGTGGGGGGGTEAAGGAGGIGEPVHTDPGADGSPGTGPATTGKPGTGGGAATDTGINAGLQGGAGGGGYYGGGGGGCGFDGCGGGGGGSSFAAKDVTAVLFQTGIEIDESQATAGVVVISWEPPCSAPLEIKTGTAIRVTESGVLQISLDGKVNPVDACGVPTLTAEGVGTGTAHRDAIVPVKVINQVTATASREDLSTGDSCWVGGVLRLSQGTGTAARSVVRDVAVLPKPSIDTATAKRSPDSLSPDVKVIALPPSTCGHATIEVVDGKIVERLKQASLNESGGTVTGRAIRLASSLDCALRLKLEVLPADGEAKVATAVRFTGVPVTSVTRCEKK